MQSFKRGDKVECNGNKEAIVQSYYGDNMYVVRLFDGCRVIGDVCVGSSELRVLDFN